MTNVNFNIQLRFLTELEEALGEALTEYADEPPEKRAELTYMRAEVLRAQRMVRDKMGKQNKEDACQSHSVMPTYNAYDQQAIYS